MLFPNLVRHWLHRALKFAAVLTMCSSTTVLADSEPFIIDLYMGEPVPQDVMLDDLSAVRIVYLGEIHTIARHHELQVEILRGLLDRDLKVAVGMEMFSRESQPILDRWQTGNQSVADLILELRREHWTNLQDYEKVLTLARERHVPIVGLNARDTLVRKVAREGLDGLTESEKREIPAGVEKINPLQDRLLRLRLRVHKAFEKASLDRIVLAQALRDETMAETVSGFLDTSDGKNRLMLVIAGSGHVNYGFGIPERVQSRNSLPYRIVMPTESGELVLTEAEKRQSVPVDITHEDLRFIPTPIADYLQAVPLKKERPQRRLRQDLQTTERLPTWKPGKM
ncbi:MAG: ChaN family lipoprotein [Desulfomonilaceae bacterium]